MAINQWPCLPWERLNWIRIGALAIILILGMLLTPGIHATGTTSATQSVSVKLSDDIGWSALDTGVNGEVLALAIMGNDVYVGGFFDSAGTCTTGCTNIAKWNTTTHSWSALGAGVDGEVFAIAIDSGLVYVGGEFDHASTTPANRVAVWDGSGWSALGTGTNGPVRAITVSSGDIYVGGEFTQAGGCTGAGFGCYFIADWSYPGWSALSTGMSSYVFALADGGNKIYAGGSFYSASGISDTVGIAIWDKPGWFAMGTGVNGIAGYSVNAITVSGSDVYAGGMFDSAGGVTVNNIAKWKYGSGWATLAPEISDNGAVYAIAVSGGVVYAGGDFQDNDTGAPNHIARWQAGSGWSALGSGTDGTVHAIAILSNDIYVGGSFDNAGGVAYTGGIAKYRLPSVPFYLPLLLR